MSNITPAGNTALGAAAKAFAGQVYETGDEGLEGGYGILKYRGKVWTLSYKGQSYNLVYGPAAGPAKGSPRSDVDLVVVRAPVTKSKVFYPKWEEGSHDRPVCWSNDAITPDISIPNPQHSNCALCKWNVFGSRTTDSGKPAKACSDYKRLAVYLDPALVQDALGMTIDEPVLLRVPAASLNDFGSFAKKMSQGGLPLPAFIAKIKFDPTVSYPKFVFDHVRNLDDKEALVSISLRNDPLSLRIVGGDPAGGTPAQLAGPSQDRNIGYTPDAPPPSSPPPQSGGAAVAPPAPQTEFSDADLDALAAEALK